jgi:hypothetical protein
LLRQANVEFRFVASDKDAVRIENNLQVEVEAWRSTKPLFSFNPFMEVKQNSSEFRGVVAHPLGQHTLLVPLTEKVV